MFGCVCVCVYFGQQLSANTHLGLDNVVLVSAQWHRRDTVVPHISLVAATLGSGTGLRVSERTVALAITIETRFENVYMRWKYIDIIPYMHEIEHVYMRALKFHKCSSVVMIIVVVLGWIVMWMCVFAWNRSYVCISCKGMSHMWVYMLDRIVCRAEVCTGLPDGYIMVI